MQARAYASVSLEPGKATAVQQDSLQYDGQELAADTRRATRPVEAQHRSLPAPNDRGRSVKRDMTADFYARCKGMYGAGQVLPTTDGNCRGGQGARGSFMSETSRDYDALLDAWAGWRTVSAPMREDVSAALSSSPMRAQAELGYSRSRRNVACQAYDMTPAEFASRGRARLWEEVKPLYDELHCHVRAKLGEQYGEDKVPQDQSDSGAPARQHVGADLGVPVRHDGTVPGRRRASTSTHTLQTKDYSPTRNDTQSAEELLRVAGHAAPSGHLLGAFACSRSRPTATWFAMRVPGDFDDGNDLRIKMCIRPEL